MAEEIISKLEKILKKFDKSIEVKQTTEAITKETYQVGDSVVCELIPKGTYEIVVNPDIRLLKVVKDNELNQWIIELDELTMAAIDVKQRYIPILSAVAKSVAQLNKILKKS